MRPAVVLILALVGGLAACEPAPTAPTPVVVALRVDLAPDADGYSGADLVADLVDAAELFAPLGGQFEVDDGAPAGLRCATWDMGTAAATTNAAGISVSCLYLVNQPRSTRLRVLAHELGHAMGLLHVESPQALMYFETGAAAQPELTAEDLSEWARVHGGGL